MYEDIFRVKRLELKLLSFAKKNFEKVAFHERLQKNLYLENNHYIKISDIFTEIFKKKAVKINHLVITITFYTD